MTKRSHRTDLLDWPELWTKLTGIDDVGMKLEEFRESGALVVRAELPGIDPEKDVEITVADGQLHIHAERRESTSEGEEGKAGYRSEFRYGAFDRFLTLPASTTEEKVTASYKDGILEVRIPVDESAQVAHRVAVTKS